MEIFVTHREISLCLQPTCVKLPMVKVLHMKQGMITAVSKIPQITKSFNNYSEIQKYWKDMYGYLLPIVPEERIKYFNVVFRIPNAIPYTYPQFCVRSCKMVTIPRVDPKTTDMKPRVGTTYVMKTNVPYRKELPIASTPIGEVKGSDKKTSHDNDAFNRSVQNQSHVQNNIFSSTAQSQNFKHTDIDDSSLLDTNEKKNKYASKKLLLHSNILQSPAKDVSEKKYAPYFIPIRPKTETQCAKLPSPTCHFPLKFNLLKSAINSSKLSTRFSKTITKKKNVLKRKLIQIK
ncbi:hypothetical protein HNY73_004873 [Argiope bruennichi]|uniref:DUF4708 domain-containing protein n=1 Tax=Argiope bruennichi TaxID=94029 RepID=A0A8T0FV05_ARGBR|nr:hypothetical protein HNY73_004873 [Argiope bruennichi]